MISILIADTDEIFADEICNYTKHVQGIEVVEVTGNGNKAFELIKKLMPDVVIMDLILLVEDGFRLLEKVNSNDFYYKPIFIVASYVSNENFIRSAIELGVQYYFIKPVQMGTLFKRIRQLYYERFEIPFLTDQKTEEEKAAEMQEKEIIADDIRPIAGKLLKEMGILPNLPGYRYLMSAVLMNFEEKIIEKKEENEIYKRIAAQYGTTPKKVERAARVAVEKVLKRAEYLGAQVGRPLIFWFISEMSKKVREELLSIKKQRLSNM